MEKLFLCKVALHHRASFFLLSAFRQEDVTNTHVKVKVGLDPTQPQSGSGQRVLPVYKYPAVDAGRCALSWITSMLGTLGRGNQCSLILSKQCVL